MSDNSPSRYARHGSICRPKPFNSSLRAISSSTDEVVASYLRQYQVGRKTWLDVLNAQRETTQARYTLADLEAGIQAAHLRLLMLSGRIDARSLSRLGP